MGRTEKTNPPRPQTTLPHLAKSGKVAAKEFDVAAGRRTTVAIVLITLERDWAQSTWRGV